MSFNGSKGSKGLSQQVFLRVSEELAFMNLNYKLGFYCQKMDDPRASHLAVAHGQVFSEVVFSLDAQTSCVLTSTRLFFIDLPWMWWLGQAQWGCVDYYQAPQGNFDVRHLCASRFPPA